MRHRRHDPALRAGVKASLRQLALKIRNAPPSVPWLRGFGRLERLAILGEATQEQHEHLAAKIVEAGLPARLQ